MDKGDSGVYGVVSDGVCGMAWALRLLKVRADRLVWFWRWGISIDVGREVMEDELGMLIGSYFCLIGG